MPKIMKSVGFGGVAYIYIRPLRVAHGSPVIDCDCIGAVPKPGMPLAFCGV